MSALLLSFALIFLAELGDKSQLVALWFATRYHWAIVILGVTIATLAVHLASTAIGATVADVLPEAVVLGIVGVSFFAFALLGAQGRHAGGERATAGKDGARGAFRRDDSVLSRRAG